MVAISVGVKIDFLIKDFIISFDFFGEHVISTFSREETTLLYTCFICFCYFICS